LYEFYKFLSLASKRRVLVVVKDRKPLAGVEALRKEGFPKDPSLTIYLQRNVKLCLSDLPKVY